MTSLQIFDEFIKPHSAGSCMHYSILQPEMLYFQHEYGLISYIKKYGFYFVLSDPIFKTSEESSQKELIDIFLKKYKNVSFVQVSQDFAEFLHREFNFYATQIGNERIIDVQRWDISGKRKQVIRTACNQAAKQHIKITENPLEKDYEAISSKWLETRRVKKREIKFLIRTHPFVEIETRTFCAYDLEGILIAYIIFDPIFKNGKCIGYVPDISRSSPVFKQGTYYAIMVEAIRVFKAEGLQQINLGLSPLILSDNSEKYESKRLRRVFQLLRKYVTKLYNYSGINYTKSRFVADTENSKDGRVLSAFLCHKSPLPLLQVTAIFKASNVI